MDNERDPHDSYETPDVAVHQLLSNVALTGGICDPSCGRGKIIMALLDAMIPADKLMGSDKHRYDLPPRQGALGDVGLQWGHDFLDWQYMDARKPNLIMNPPYSQADEHVRHGLSILQRPGQMCVLLRHTWMCAQKRADLLKHLAKIVMVGRLKMLPMGVPDQGHSGTVDFSWFVFAPYVVGSTEIVRAR